MIDLNIKLKECLDLAENLGWSVTQEDNFVYNLGQFSPAGYDFNMTIETENDASSFVYNLREFCNNFDVSEETYLWLDNTGHGKNGAPYDMKDVYEDMEACLDMAKELLNEIEILLSNKIYLIKNNDTYSAICSEQVVSNGVFLVKEQEYPVSMYYKRYDLNGSDVTDVIDIKNQEDLINTLNMAGLSGWQILSLWDFDKDKNTNKKLTSLFAASYQRQMDLILKDHEEV